MSLCACMGPTHGEEFCYCVMRSRRLPLNAKSRSESAERLRSTMAELFGYGESKAEPPKKISSSLDSITFGGYCEKHLYLHPCPKCERSVDVEAPAIKTVSIKSKPIKEGCEEMTTISPESTPTESTLNGSKRAAAFALYQGPFIYYRGYIHDTNGHMVADQSSYVEDTIALRVRGWGRIGYLPNAAELQDEVGGLIAEAMTKFWEENNNNQQFKENSNENQE